MVIMLYARVIQYIGPGGCLAKAGVGLGHT